MYTRNDVRVEPRGDDLANLSPVESPDNTEPTDKTYAVKTPPIKAFRFFLIRLLSCPVPGLMSCVPIVGGRTVPELVIIFGVPLIALAIVFGAKFDAGNMSDFMGMVAIALGLRHNFMAVLFGISFERAVYYHKGFALLCLLFLVIHGNQFGSNASGVGIGFIMFLMALMYTFKPYFFEVFYYIHVIGYAILIPVTLAHGSVLIPLAGIAWVVDLILRYWLTLKRIDAEITILPGEVIKLRFKKSFDYTPGQYCFIHINAVDCVEFHPFSLSSAPSSEYTSFHIRAMGNWTKKLQDLVKANITPENPWMNVKISVEGPFGTTSINTSTYNVRAVSSPLGDARLMLLPLFSLFLSFN